MCDTLCAIANGHTLFAKDSDRPPDEAQVVESYVARPSGGKLRTQYLEIPDEGAFALVGSRPTWLWGFEHGVNEHRVAIGNEAVYSTATVSTDPEGLIGMDLVRLGLERGRTARAAVDAMTSLLERHGQSGDCYEAGGSYHSSFLVADPSEAWVLETAGATWAAERFTRDAAISNRIGLGADWDLASSDVAPGSDFDVFRDPTTDTGFADVRLQASRACLARVGDPPTAGELTEHLRDHGSGGRGMPAKDEFTVCMHIRGVSNTTAAMVCDLPQDPAQPTKVWAALGSPCVSVFVPFTFPDVPEVLSDPSVWERFAVLRDRVERDGSELSRIRAVLDPLEASVWEGADDAGAGIRACLKELQT
jgi:secernin